MKITEILKQYREAARLTGVAIAKELGLKSRLVNAWLNNENQPAGLNLILLEEFLREKGYQSVGDTHLFPECILYIRAALYQKRITIEDVSEYFGFGQPTMMTVLRTGKLPAKHKGVCIQYVQTLQSSAEKVSVDEIVSLLTTISGPLELFLKQSTVESRTELRRQVNMFNLSNQMGRLCSETAYNRQ